MRIVLYYRHGYEDMLDAEMEALRANFLVTDDLDQIQAGDLVLCRFSLMPFAEALEEEIKARGAQLVHSVNAHDFIADMREWYPLLGDLTPRTWFDDNVEDNGPFFVKGITNSIKSNWSSCFASNLEDLARVMHEQSQNALMAAQPYAIRKFVPLVNYGKDPETGAPLTEEYRVFVFQGQILSSGFYWQSRIQEITEYCAKNNLAMPDTDSVPQDVVESIANLIGDRADYMVIDIGRTITGEWIVIELNDATMSGLSANDPWKLYANLRQAIERSASRA